MELAPTTVLLVEDHAATRTFLADNLCADGFDVLQAGSLAAARPLLRRRDPDLCVTDLALPDGDGLDLLREVRGAERECGGIDPDLPLIVLTGRSGELDRLRAFDRGCDDYLTKPFSYQELHARIGAVLRRARCGSHRRRTRVGPLEIDPVALEARLRGRVLRLSKTEFRLLRTLAADPGRVYTRGELLHSVWGSESAFPTRTLDSHAYRLRHKLTAEGDSFLVNVWGVGYRLVDEGRV